ncbi:DsbA family oxidoreductase [Variovorax sp. 160MFSha2.1]|uniref:DsbA family oxidoreductase n=1 Tax=Variovorax sp. 160MFSha2.1 TaxID=3158367 RepID=UPI003AACABFA
MNEEGQTHMLRIDLYTEITCPWCIVGQYRLDKVLAQGFAGLAADIRHHPVLLMPDAPASGTYIPDLLRSRHGITDPAIAFSRVESEARSSGLELDLRRQPWAFPTQAAHALILAAGERGLPQHRLAVAITQAYFLGAKNIGNADVLAAIAVDHGFDRMEARAIAVDRAWHGRVEEAARRAAVAGVRSVPHFAFGPGIVLRGGRSEQEIASCIREALGGVAVS